MALASIFITAYKTRAASFWKRLSVPVSIWNALTLPKTKMNIQLIMPAQKLYYVACLLNKLYAYQGSKIALVSSYLRVAQAAGQVKILIFLVKIIFFPYMPIFFVMQGECLVSDISSPAYNIKYHTLHITYM